MAARTRRGSRAADRLDARMGSRQAITASVVEVVSGGEGNPAPQTVNVSAEALAAATHRGDQIHGVDKLAKFNTRGEVGASLVRAGREDKGRSVSAGDWHENSAAIFKNALAFLGEDRGVAFIRAWGALMEIAATDPDGFGKATVALGRSVFVSDGNVGIGTVPAAPLHVAKAGDQMILEDNAGNVTRLRSDENGFAAIAESGVNTLSGKLVITEPDGTTLTLDEAGMTRESGLAQGYYQKRGVSFDGGTTKVLAHAIDDAAIVLLTAPRGFMGGNPSGPSIEIRNPNPIFGETNSKITLAADSIVLTGPVDSNTTWNGAQTFNGDVVLPANTGLFNRIGHLKIMPSNGAATTLADGHLWGTAADGLHWYADGKTWNTLSLFSESAGIATLDGGLNVAGSGRRITGDFSSLSPNSNRALFQTSTANGATRIGLIPNGTQDTSGIDLFTNSDPSAGFWFGITVSNVRAQLNILKKKDGSMIPLRFSMNNVIRQEITATGEIILTPNSDFSVVIAGSKKLEVATTGVAFFGATPAAQQTGGASTAAASYGANEQSMLQKAYNTLRTFGLLS